jgi:hypothetical protein
VFTIPFTKNKKPKLEAKLFIKVVFNFTWPSMVEVICMRCRGLPRFAEVDVPLICLQNFFLTPTLHLECVIFMKVECDFVI